MGRKLSAVLLSLSSMTCNWALAQSEAPPLVITSDNHSGAAVWAGDRAGAPALNGTVNLQPVTTGTQQGAAVNSTGSSLQVNSSTVAQPAAVVRQNNVFCSPASPTWSAASTCTGNLPRTIAGGSAVATDATAPATGSATYACQADGSWAAPTSVSCTATCGATTGAWTGVTSCSGPLAAATTGQYVGVTSTNGNSGTAQFLCSAAGSWSLASNGGCTSPYAKGFLWISCCWEFKNNYKSTWYAEPIENTQATSLPPENNAGPFQDGAYFRYLDGSFGGTSWRYFPIAGFARRVGMFNYTNCTYGVRLVYGSSMGALICDKVPA